MSLPQFLGYLAPVLVGVLIAATGWLKAHSAQQTAERADAKATKALNGQTEPAETAP